MAKAAAYTMTMQHTPWQNDACFSPFIAHTAMPRIPTFQAIPPGLICLYRHQMLS